MFNEVSSQMTAFSFLINKMGNVVILRDVQTEPST